MSYLALYRKYRPSSFDSVFGQDHIVTTLKNQLKADRIGHAYLFCGTRGTGKTSIAKLFAKAVNCEHPVDGNPCGECPSCRAIEEHTSMNIIEIDAASNNGVDNIRDIVDEVRYSPTEGRYKVYIIDEVHMLSTGAFNALLKTLEEPPSYVIFILATTEVHKIPITILSRCQRYDFRRISADDITECLRGLMAKEGIPVEEKALRYVAKAGDGSMRDAQSILDQCIAFNIGRELTYERVLEVLGAVDVEVFATLLRYIAKGSVDDCMEVIEDTAMKGREMGQFVSDFAWYLRNLLVAKTADNPRAVLDLSAERMEMLLHEAEVVSEETLIRYIRIMSELSNRMRYATQKRLLVELEIIRLCKPETDKDLSALVGRIEAVERRLDAGVVVKNADAGTDRGTLSDADPDSSLHGEASDRVTSPAQDRNEAVRLARAMSEDLRIIAADWKRIISAQSSMLKPILAGSSAVPAGDSRLKIVTDNEVDRDILVQQQHIDAIKKTIGELTGKSVDLEISTVSDEKSISIKALDITKLIQIPIEIED